MNRSLAPAPRRLVGSPVRWAADAAGFAALVPVVGFASVFWWYGVSLGTASAAPIVTMAACSGLCAGLLATATADLLERFRGQVPLPLLAVLVTMVGGVWGLGTAHLSAWTLGYTSSPNTTLILIGLGLLLAGAGWLPYTMARVMHRSTLPVLAGGLMLTGVGTIVGTWLLPIAHRIGAALWMWG